MCLISWLPTAYALDPAKQFRDYAIDNWGTDAGLPQISVLSIMQDRTGYIWVGTQAGIARFDGLRFDVFDRHNSDGTDTLNVDASLSDSFGRLWFGTPNGLLVYENNHFRTVAARLPAKPVHAIIESHDGEIWVATSNGVMRYDGNAMVLVGDSTPAYSLARDADAIWRGGAGTVTRHAHEGERVFHIPGGDGVPVTRMAVSEQGLWIGTPSGLYLLPNGADQIVAQSLGIEVNKNDSTASRIENLFVDRDRNVWIGTPSTLFRRRPNGTFEHVLDEDLVRGVYVVSAFEDREGNLWLGSRSEGLFRLWNGWATRLGTADGLTDALIWSVTRDPTGHIVLGSNSNVMRMDEGGLHEILSTRQIPNLSAYELEYDDRGRLWVGTRSGLAIYDHGEVTTPQAFSRFARIQINTVVPQGGVYWIGSEDGLFRYDGKELRRIALAPGVAESPVRGVHISADGTMTVSTEAGMRRMKDGMLYQPAWAKPLEGRYITSAATIGPGLLGITTRDSGIGLLRDDHLLMLDDSNGLPSNNSWAMQTVDNYLYVPTMDGVWRLPIAELPDPVTGHNVTLSPQRVIGGLNGMQHMHCCNGGAKARVQLDGTKLWFPAIHGAVLVDTKAIVPLPLPPTVVVEQLHHGDRWYRANEAIDIDGLRRDIEVRFTALSFREPQSVRFRIRLDGYDADWHDVGARRTAFYTNLPPGQFRFLVEASASGAQTEFTAGSNPQLAELSFYVVPRWFERRSVQGVALLILLVLGALAPLLIRNHYRRLGVRLEGQVRDRTSELHHANVQQLGANRALQESNTLLAEQIEERLAVEGALQNRNADLETLNHRLEVTQSQLIQSEKLASIGLLAAGVAHEINNPIGYVSSNLSTLQEYTSQLLRAIEAFIGALMRKGDAPTAIEVQEIRRRFDIDMLTVDLPELLKESREGVGRVSKIVSNLKDFSRIDRNEMWVLTNVHDGLESTLNIVSNELKFKAKIVRKFADLPPIECLSSELNQVFMNVLMNAGHAIKENGTITVSTGRATDTIWITIGDDGEGIPADVLPRIFDPFYTTKPIGQGTGLGLSISYGIVAKHHGTIEVASILGQGAQFRIELPIGQPKVIRGIPRIQ